MENSTIKILKIEPGLSPEVIETELTLENLQDLVGGYIECVYPWDDNATVIVNEDGKLNHLEPNRVLLDSDGDPFDIILGTMLVSGFDDEDFCSLTQEQIEKYSHIFSKPYDYYEYLNRY